MSPILLVAFLVAVAAPGEGAALRMPPVDRCASDPSFAAFRTELDAVGQRAELAVVPVG